MCNGTSQRTSQGGSIAVLHAPRHSHTPQSQPSPAAKEMTLLFSNPLSRKAGTSVEVQGFEDTAREKDEVGRGKEKCWIVIHRDGDLSSSTSTRALTCASTSPQAHANAMYTFPLDATTLLAAKAENGPRIVQLPQKLHLGVGNEGIVGRRVSFVTSSCSSESLAEMSGGVGMTTLAEGIVGWN
ncbi:uncharacterized protein SETTUDRAFT_166135 [Exserohilum turcica Et28A]|uniref:Uncharacterized protein n=1 Tax=Exserohilum turcicum (strain 28A) TaxID=671987 RepID=R0JZZ7_EXST2|nr:uncharacterized protein SETTUDRAFT_166135 [Exserohilum turcica Et28A]EOA81777.1 hypothetical protein SETTUDRAFT_166135 [Exserohilum turcica Et28A]